MPPKQERDLWGLFFLENQEKGPLFAGIDCRDDGSLEQLQGILLTMQDGNLPEGHQHRGTQSPEMKKKRDGFLKAFFGPLDPAVCLKPEESHLNFPVRGAKHSLWI